MRILGPAKNSAFLDQIRARSPPRRGTSILPWNGNQPTPTRFAGATTTCPPRSIQLQTHTQTHTDTDTHTDTHTHMDTHTDTVTETRTLTYAHGHGHGHCYFLIRGRMMLEMRDGVDEIHNSVSQAPPQDKNPQLQRRQTRKKEGGAHYLPRRSGHTCLFVFPSAKEHQQQRGTTTRPHTIPPETPWTLCLSLRRFP